MGNGREHSSMRKRATTWVATLTLALCVSMACLSTQARAAERPKFDNGETWRDWPGAEWTWRDIAWRLWGYRDPYGPVPDLMMGLIDGQVRLLYDEASNTYQAMIYAYARRRIVPMSFLMRDPMHYGPWTAHKDYYATDADDNGALTEWEDSYYVTHDWSDYGKQILSIIPGDTVEVNGRTMRVADIFDYPKEAYSNEIWALVGEDAVVLQTCEPNSDLNRIAYGRWIAP